MNYLKKKKKNKKIPRGELTPRNRQYTFFPIAKIGKLYILYISFLISQNCHVNGITIDTTSNDTRQRYAIAENRVTYKSSIVLVHIEVRPGRCEFRAQQVDVPPRTGGRTVAEKSESYVTA